MAKLLGILYHKDTETDSDNYIAFTHGDTIEEINKNIKLINTPKYTEQIKILEFGEDVDSSLHKQLQNNELDYYYSKAHFWCGSELEKILNLSFSKHIDYSIVTKSK